MVFWKNSDGITTFITEFKIYVVTKIVIIDTSITHIRPRFKISIPRRQEEIMNRIPELLEKSTQQVVGKIVDNHIILDIVEEEVHYWSPQLNFRVESDELDEEITVVSGLIGPRPAVWTMFMFIYFLLGLIGFVVGSFGVAKTMLGNYSNLLLAFPISILFMLSAYKVGKYGEQLAKDQIEILKQFVRDTIYFADEKM